MVSLEELGYFNYFNTFLETPLTEIESFFPLLSTILLLSTFFSIVKKLLKDLLDSPVTGGLILKTTDQSVNLSYLGGLFKC